MVSAALTMGTIPSLGRGLRRLMDVILHVGAHRTGTTSLQAFLERNRQLLNDNGIAVWTPRWTRSALFSGLYRAPHRIDDGIENAAMQACSGIRGACDDLEAGWCSAATPCSTARRFRTSPPSS